MQQLCALDAERNAVQKRIAKLEKRMLNCCTSEAVRLVAEINALRMKLNAKNDHFSRATDAQFRKSIPDELPMTFSVNQNRYRQ